VLVVVLAVAVFAFVIVGPVVALREFVFVGSPVLFDFLRPSVVFVVWKFALWSLFPVRLLVVVVVVVVVVVFAEPVVFVERVLFVVVVVAVLAFVVIVAVGSVGALRSWLGRAARASQAACWLEAAAALPGTGGRAFNCSTSLSIKSLTAVPSAA